MTFKTVPNSSLAQSELSVLQTLARYNNGHIIRIYDYFLNDSGHLVFVLPRLKPFIYVPMDLKDAFDILKQLLVALEQVHECGWVHLDVNPSNIMRDERNQVVLIDFGLAKEISTKPFPRCGTAGYIAPEVFAGQAVDPRVDVFSAGIIFAGLVAHYLPEASDRLSGVGSHYSNREAILEARELFLEVGYDLVAWKVPECVRKAAILAAGMLHEDWNQRLTVAECLSMCNDDSSWVSLHCWLQSRRVRQRREWDFSDDDFL